MSLKSREKKQKVKEICAKWKQQKGAEQKSDEERAREKQGAAGAQGAGAKGGDGCWTQRSNAACPRTPVNACREEYQSRQSTDKKKVKIYRSKK